ncbi:MAG TPA: class I SAM-dependent methyltransferase [Ktedonobacteraceae bacterium]|nr:class I SAM-dependent methyltransferase [Ktedonobacteraceae bacterium]
MPTNPPKKETTYVVDSESGMELNRLMSQERLLNEAFGELFPAHIDMTRVHDILDIACGPGGWVLDMAFKYPKINVTGIDISKQVTEYARTHAFTTGMNNATFRVMDAMKPLDFPDNSFDFINARLILGFMLPSAWPKLLQECQRILRPGGFICLTECETGQTNSPAFEKLTRMATQAMFRAGQSFSPDGYHIGILPMLGKLVQDAGYQNIFTKAYAVDFSAGTERYEGFYQDMVALCHLIQPFLLKWEVTTPEEVAELYQQMQVELMLADFRTVWFYMAVCGQKAE